MATLILEDGTRYEGTLFGHKAPVTGEVVFTTGMTGYQETLTDPSYCGQIVCMTYPLMGNVGINDIDSESAGVQMRGFIVSELCDAPSNWQMKKTLDQYLDEQGVTGLYGVDTRALTRARARLRHAARAHRRGRSRPRRISRWLGRTRCTIRSRSAPARRPTTCRATARIPSPCWTSASSAAFCAALHEPRLFADACSRRTPRRADHPRFRLRRRDADQRPRRPAG